MNQVLLTMLPLVNFSEKIKYCKYLLPILFSVGVVKASLFVNSQCV